MKNFSSLCQKYVNVIERQVLKNPITLFSLAVEEGLIAASQPDLY